MRLGRPSGGWAAAACLATLIAGCGNDGSSGASIPGSQMQVVASVQGTILAPDGQFAAAERWWWPKGLHFAQPAYAVTQFEPIQSIEHLALYFVQAADAAHGDTNTSRVTKNDVLSLPDGKYQVVNNALTDIEGSCRLMLQVSSGSLATRGFVLRHDNNDIDAASEVTVRLILKEIHDTSAQLCDFSVQELQTITDLVRSQDQPLAEGATLPDLYENLFDIAVGDSRVQKALSDAIAQ